MDRSINQIYFSEVKNGEIYIYLSNVPDSMEGLSES